ncbi:MAG: hypothetical protein AAGD00_07180 [Planctomycetota bacterium]
MTTVQTLLFLSCFSLALVACSKPYQQETRHLAPGDPTRQATWAVAPLRNESGVSLVDPLRVSDELFEAVAQVNGVTAVPINRSIAAMRSLGMTDVATPEDAIELARLLDADAIIVGTITAYDPYDPPQLGMSLALITINDGRATAAPVSNDFDPYLLSTASTDSMLRTDAGTRAGQPFVAAGGHFDASDGITRDRVRAFATGRHLPDGPLGWQRYIKSMGLYTRYVCFELVGRLIAAERSRRPPLEPTKDA